MAFNRALNDRRQERREGLLERQSTGCIFAVKIDGVTVYSVDLDTIPDDEDFPFSTDAFTPGPDSVIEYVTECPDGVTDFPALDVGSLVLETGPEAPPPVSNDPVVC